MSGAGLHGTTDAQLGASAVAAHAVAQQGVVDRFAGYPVIPAYVLRSAEGRSTPAVMWCDWCEDLHHHSVGDGHRCPHCGIADSGHQRFGYVLKIQGNRRSEQVVLPRAPFAGHRRLRTAMQEAAVDLRRALLKHLLGLKRVGETVDRDIHGYRVGVLGRSSHFICSPVLPRAKGARRPKARPSPRFGTGLSALAADAYGVSRGVAVARMLQAVTLDDYDPQFLRELGALVDAWERRCGGRSDRYRGSQI